MIFSTPKSSKIILLDKIKKYTPKNTYTKNPCYAFTIVWKSLHERSSFFVLSMITFG